MLPLRYSAAAVTALPDQHAAPTLLRATASRENDAREA